MNAWPDAIGVLGMAGGTVVEGVAFVGIAVVIAVFVHIFQIAKLKDNEKKLKETVEQLERKNDDRIEQLDKAVSQLQMRIDMMS